jgi:hypothetical protein
MELYAVLALIMGFIAFLAVRARGSVGTFSDRAGNPKRPVSGGMHVGTIGNDLVDPGPRGGGTRPLD